MTFEECKKKYPIGLTTVRYYTYDKDKLFDGTFSLLHCDHSIFVCHFGEQDETIVALYDTVIGYFTIDNEIFVPHRAVGWNLQFSMEPDKNNAWTADLPDEAEDIHQLEKEYMIDAHSFSSVVNQITKDIAQHALLENEDVSGTYDGYNWLTKDEMALQIQQYIHPDVFEIEDDDLFDAYEVLKC